MWILILFPAVAILLIWNAKLRFLKMREGCTPIVARVIEYRNERGPMRNDFTKLPYPYVSINEDRTRLFKVKYASSGSHPFKINEDINVFWFSGTLYYWETFDTGIYKYIPKKFRFKKSMTYF